MLDVVFLFLHTAHGISLLPESCANTLLSYSVPKIGLQEVVNDVFDISGSRGRHNVLDGPPTYLAL